ncbi:MAG: AAA family ATPase [Candidatus Baldrarchaeia archaeon]
MGAQLLNYASYFAKMAIKLDRKGDYEASIKYYLKAAETLLQLAKLTENRKLRALYYQRAQEYIERCKELRRYVSRRMPVPEKKASELPEDLKQLSEIIESAIVTERPLISFNDIADLEEAKGILREAIIIPMLRPDLFKGARRPWKGILLFGPPGCGKTLLAKAVAAECNATFFNVDAATLVSKWLGESEKLVKTLFTLARERQPAIIFIDEVDSIASVRREDEIGGERRLKTQFLLEMDGLKSESDERIVVIGATNRPWEIDPAMRRRFERRIYVPPPDKYARVQIFKIHTRGLDLDPSVDFDKLAELTDGYSGADIALVCREAAMIPIRELDEQGLLLKTEKIRPITMDDFLEALKRIKPSISKEEIAKYEDWARAYSA